MSEPYTATKRPAKLFGVDTHICQIAGPGVCIESWLFDPEPVVRGLNEAYAQGIAKAKEMAGQTHE
jgi:hypothetical protein